MTKLNIPRDKIFVSSKDFFLMNGSGVMRLTPDAAKEVCLHAEENGFLIGKIEGGVWRHPGFGARADCIWDGITPPADIESIKKNNTEAAAFIDEESASQDVFILTAHPL